ncbi:MAG: hypothetical protein ACI97A_001451 [Planctomycetota bacterium]|jgi:hypothetical protein
MNKFTIILLLIISAQASEAQVTGSYQRVKGKELGRFVKTKGASAHGRSVALIVPGSIFPAKESAQKRRFACFFKGVRLEIYANNPYWIQTRRKLAKSSSGNVLVKGRVRHRKSRKGKITHYLLVDTLQKTGKGKRIGKKRKKS